MAQVNPLRHLHVHNRKVSHTPVSRDEDLAITKTQRPFAFDQWELETSAPERKSFPGHIRFKLQYSLAFALRGPPGSGSTRAPQCHERSLCPSNGELKGRDACRSRIGISRGFHTAHRPKAPMSCGASRRASRHFPSLDPRSSLDRWHFPCRLQITASRESGRA